MKFTDGYWQHLPGVTVLRPREIADVVVGEESLTVYASTVPLTSRGDTLNKALVTVSFHSPMDDVIGVRIEHHRGGTDRGPAFALNRTAADVKVVEAEERGTGELAKDLYAFATSERYFALRRQLGVALA